MGIETIIIQSLIATNPAFAPVGLFIGTELGSGIIEQIVNNPSLSLNPFTIIDNSFYSLGNIFTDIWTWLLYNLITPFLVIVLTIIFFIGQYYLIRLYIILFKFIFKSSLETHYYLKRFKFYSELIREIRT